MNHRQRKAEKIKSNNNSFFVFIETYFYSFRARDIWFVGTLIWEIFNGNSSGNQSYRQLGSIPRPLSAAYGELVNPNPSVRTSLEKLVQSPFIQNNPLVECLLFLEQIQVKKRNRS